MTVAIGLLRAHRAALEKAPPAAEELGNGEQGMAMLSGYIIRPARRPSER
jgi:hypothetical protein